MLTPDELLKEISTAMGKIKVVKLAAMIKKEQFALRDLTDLTFHPDKNIAFRAAWILENAFLQKPESYLNDMDYLLSRISDVKHPGCQRHYAKIVMHITSPKTPASIKEKLAQIDFEHIIERLFDWLIDPKTKIAVKVFAAQALFNVRERYPWIAEELASQVQFLMRNGSAAIQSRGKKLLAQL
jgi:hypothetical protein